jgi:transcription initiation factor TFIIE subunit alpha
VAISKKKAKPLNKAPKAKIATKAVKKDLKASKSAVAVEAKSKKGAKLLKGPVAPPEPVVDKEALNKELLQRVVKILSDSGVRQNLIELGGENALAIVRNFYGNCSDDELAKKLKIKISDVRSTLNKLHNEGLVNYIREKDSETGWYSYSWSLNHQRMEKWASIQNGRLATHATDGGEEFYFCPSCGSSSVTNFESAANISFRCDRCNKMLEFIDGVKLAELYEKK